MQSIAENASKVDNYARIKLGVSFHFHNKKNDAAERWSEKRQQKDNLWALARFETVDYTPRQIADHILAGRAISIAAHRDNYRHKKNFISSQLIGLDFDNGMSVEQLAADDMAGRYAFLIYATPTSTPEKPKSRALFILDAAITEPERYSRLLKRLMFHYGQTGAEADRACKDTSRLFYGSDNAQHHTRLETVLQVSALEALPQHPDETRAAEYVRRRAERAANPTPRDSSHEYSYALAAIQSEADTLAKTGKGERHNQNMHAAYIAGTFVGAGAIDESEAENLILDAALSAGRDRAEAEKDTRDGIQSGRRTPRDIPPPKPTARRKRSVQARERKELNKLLSALPSDSNGKPIFTPFEPEKLIMQRAKSVEYLAPSDYTAPDVAGYDLAIKSDMGTGKTSAFAEAHKHTKRLLSITYLIGLAEKLSDSLGTECYKGLAAADLRRIDRLTSTIQSLWKIADVEPFDVVHIDEPEKVLKALGGKTLKGHEAVRAYSALKLILQKAKRVVCTDAHLTPITRQFIEALRGKENVLTCENTYVRPRGEMVMYSSAAAVTITVERLADEDAGVVVVATNSEKEVKRLEALFSERYGEESVFAIYGEVSGEPERKAVIYDINRRIVNYRVFIYSPSLASGIDIQAPVRAVCGIFNAEPLSAGDDHQMLNRCRNAQEYHVYVQRAEGERETDPVRLTRDGLDNATLTAAAAEFDSAAYTPEQAGLHRLVSLFDAQTNASKNRLFDHFLTLAQGYSRITSAPEIDTQAVKVARAEATTRLEAIEKARTLAADPVDDQTFNLLMENGKVTPQARAGFRRWQIEKAAGREISAELYDLLRPSDARTALYSLRDALHATESDLKARDKNEQRAPISKRKHYTRRVRILRHLLNCLFKGNMQATLERADLETVMSDFTALFGEELARLFNRRADKSEKPAALARWLLAKMHLKLESVQIMENRQRRRVYRLNVEALAQWGGLAASSWQRYQDDQTQRKEKAITQNRDIHTTTPTENEKSLDQFDREYEHAIKSIDDNSNRQALTQQYLENRAALAAKWKARGCAIPRESRIARQYAGV